MSMVPAAFLHTAAQSIVLDKKCVPLSTPGTLQQRGKSMHANLFTTAVTRSR
jgi:hypothetical protein